MKISESQLNQMIRESIQKRLTECAHNGQLRELVKESLENFGYYPNEAAEDNEDEDKDKNVEDMTLDDLGLGDKTLKDLGLDATDVDDLEAGDFSDDDDKDSNEKDSEKNDDDEEEDTTGVNQIEKFFKKPGVDNAPYAYELFDVRPEKGKDTNAMKNARRKFSAKKNHELNDNGYPYSFTPSEKNELQNMISSAGLSESKINEAVKNAIKKVLK